MIKNGEAFGDKRSLGYISKPESPTSGNISSRISTSKQAPKVQYL